MMPSTGSDWNTVSGTSHWSPELDREMEDYFTSDNVKKMLFRCEKYGITTLQMRADKHIMRLLREYRQEWEHLFSNHNGEVTQITSSDGPHMFETNGFYWQLRQFLENLLQGKKSPDDLFSVLETMRLTDCIRLRQAHYMA